MEASYGAKIIAALGKLGHPSTNTQNPDKTNKGKILGDLFLWKTVAKYAQNKYETLLDAAIKDGAIDNPRALGEGDHTVHTSDHFVYGVKVSKPRQSFDPSKLATSLAKSKFKVPSAVTLQFCENAKKEGNPQVTVMFDEVSKQF